ncbi:calcium-binding protein [Halomonas sp. A29]|uniref:calcium-binding protein n=1 Tax=Halomonas sp. A29 TaxID=3102786 RepID=UPI00398ACD13
MTSFSEFLGNTTLDSQNVFSKEYSAWLNSVVLTDTGVTSWLQAQLDGDMLDAFLRGDFKVEINQNSSDGAPYLTFGDSGSFALADLFPGEKASFEWSKGKAVQERWFFDSYSVPGGEGENQAPTDIRLDIDPTFADSLKGSNPQNSTATGATIGTLTAIDTDAGDTHTFSIIDEQSRFEIVDGNVLKLKDGQDIQEGDGTFTMTIEVIDSAGNTYYETFTFKAGATGSPAPGDQLLGTEASGDGTLENPAVGDDILFGFRGQDTLNGDATSVFGSSGDDVLFGGHGNDILYGGAGNDQLFGGNGDDLLVGGQGDDTLWGGAGADTFKWMLGDQGSVSAPAVDRIMDFSKTEGDKIDLKDLLGGDAELLFTAGDGKAELHIETQGNGVDQKIIFDNASLADLQLAFDASDAVDLVAKMVGSGNLIIE